MEKLSKSKPFRMLEIYSRLVNGETLRKRELALTYGVAERSIQRDMKDLQCFLAEQMLAQDIIYDMREKGYRLIHSQTTGLTNDEILAVCKILLESRSMTKDEMLPILDKLIACCVPDEQKKAVTDLVANEKFHYIAPHHGQPILQNMWDLGQAIQRKYVIEIEYEKLKRGETVHRSIEPVGLMFSEYYFYVVGFIRDIDKQTEFENPDDIFPTIYRVDRIKSLQITQQHFRVPYASRFEEGEFRKRVQFMYGGRLRRIRFRYTGSSLEAILDRLPTAEIIEQDENGWVIEAETFGKGIEMWLRSQGDYISSLASIDASGKTHE